jgi:hypothetical protein
MPEHQWFIYQPQFGYPGEKGIPGAENLFTEVTSPNLDIDVQIIACHIQEEAPKTIDQRLKTFRYPIVWMEFWPVNVPNPEGKVYPLIYTCKSMPPSYPKKRHVWIRPDPDLWRKEWIGDKKIVLVPVHRGSTPYYLKLQIEMQKNGIAYNSVFGYRNKDWNDWQDLLIHSRLLIEPQPKPSSEIMAEMLWIGGPCMCLNYADLPEMLGPGGQLLRQPEVDIQFIKTLSDDYDEAKRYGKEGQKHIHKLLDIDHQRKVFNDSFKEAIEVGGF